MTRAKPRFVPYLRPTWTKSIPCFLPRRLKTISLGAAHTYIAHVREYPPGAVGIKLRLKSEKYTQSSCEYCCTELKRSSSLNCGLNRFTVTMGSWMKARVFTLFWYILAFVSPSKRMKQLDKTAVPAASRH